MKRRVSLPVLSLSDQRLQRKASSEGWRLCLRPNNVSVGEVDRGVLWVDGPSTPGSREGVFARRAGGCAFSCFAPAFPETIVEGFFSDRSAMRCKIPSSSATGEMVPKQNMDPGQRTILFWKVMAIELAWISDTPPTWRASCQCFGSDRAPRVAP
jgi:hypothetical protein